MTVSVTWPQAQRLQATINGVEHTLTSHRHAILTLLLMRRGTRVHADEMIQLPWPNPDFEPDWAHAQIMVQIGHLRRLGVDITPCGHGHYMIEKPGRTLIAGPARRYGVGRHRRAA